MRIIIGITGASGSVYALKLIDVLRKQRCEVHAVVSNSGWDEYYKRSTASKSRCVT